MKISVYNGSPKRENSDTMHITRAFLEGMKEYGEQEIKQVNIIDRHIEYCRGCFSCMRNDGNCVLDDDMKEILRRIPESDLLIFSFPLYAYGMPAPEAAPVTVPRLELVKEAGKQYAEDLRVSVKLLEEIGTPMIPEEQYAKIVNQ